LELAGTVREQTVAGFVGTYITGTERVFITFSSPCMTVKEIGVQNMIKRYNNYK